MSENGDVPGGDEGVGDLSGNGRDPPANGESTREDTGAGSPQEGSNGGSPGTGSKGGSPRSGSAREHPPGSDRQGSSGEHGVGSTAPDDAPWAFEEVQRFRQRWLWAAIVAASLLAVVTVAVRQPGPLLTALLLVLPLVGIPGSYLARLRTEVREDGLSIRLAPIHRSERRVPFEEIVDHETVEFSAFRDFGGIGIRRTPGGWAYVVTDGGGVRIDRGEDEPDVVVGSERPEELDRALAAGLARTRRSVEGEDRPRWRAVADFQASPDGTPPDGETGGIGTDGTHPGESTDRDPDPEREE